MNNFWKKENRYRADLADYRRNPADRCEDTAKYFNMETEYLDNFTLIRADDQL